MKIDRIVGKLSDLVRWKGYAIGWLEGKGIVHLL